MIASPTRSGRVRVKLTTYRDDTRWVPSYIPSAADDLKVASYQTQALLTLINDHIAQEALKRVAGPKDEDPEIRRRINAGLRSLNNLAAHRLQSAVENAERVLTGGFAE